MGLFPNGGPTDMRGARPGPAVKPHTLAKLGLSAAACLLLAIGDSPRPAADPGPRTVLRLAIAALAGTHGRTIKMRVEGNTIGYGSGTAIGLRFYVYYAWPDRFRLIYAEKSEAAPAMVAVIRGDKVWVWPELKPQPSEVRKKWLDPYHLFRFVLAKDAKLRASFVEPTGAHRRSVVQILATYPGYRPVIYVFDKRNYRLTKAKAAPKESPQRAQQGNWEAVVSHYRTRNGVTLPCRVAMYNNGALKATFDIVKFDVVAKLDPKLFEKPGKEKEMKRPR